MPLSTLLDSLLGTVPEAELNSYQGLSLLVELLNRAEKRLMIREANLLPEIWENENVIEGLTNFLKKNNSSLKLAFHKDCDKLMAITKLKQDNPGLSRLICQYAGKIETYWWKEGYDVRPHMIVSDRDACIEHHFKGVNYMAHFYFDTEVKRWTVLFDGAAKGDSLEKMRGEDFRSNL